MGEKLMVEETLLNVNFDDIQNADQFLDRMETLLEKYSDEEYQEHKKSSSSDNEKFYGVPVPILRKISDKVLDYCHSNGGNKGDILRALWRKNSREERRIAAEIISCLWDKNEELALKMVMEFIPDLSGWEVCDALACTGMKSYTLEHPDVVLRLVNSWIKSPNPWIRRFAIISLIPLAQNKKTEDLDFFLVILKKAMKDEEDCVQKAVSWLLREITYKDPHRIGKFLEVFARDCEPATRKIIKEGSRKIDPKDRENLLEILS